MIVERFLWSAICSANTTNATTDTSHCGFSPFLHQNLINPMIYLTTAITTNEQAVQTLTNSINSTKTELESKYDNQIATINNDIVNANNALAQAQSELLTAIQNGDAAIMLIAQIPVALKGAEYGLVQGKGQCNFLAFVALVTHNNFFCSMLCSDTGHRVSIVHNAIDRNR